MEKVIITVEMTREEAYVYAQFLKRVCFSDYRIRAKDEDEAYSMMNAGEKIREGLAKKGFAPR